MTSSPAAQRPTLPWLAFEMAKAMVRRPKCIPHLVAAVRGARRHLAQLRADGLSDQPCTVIGMVEHMGDIVAAEPVARYAARRHPGEPVLWVCREPYRGAVAGFPAVDKILTVGCLTEWLVLWATANQRGRLWDLHLNARACPVCDIGFNKTGPARKITYDTYLNLGNLLAVNCLSADIPVLDEAPQLLPDAESVAAVDRLGLPERFVVLHGMSNDDKKDWDKNKWLELVEWLTEEVGLSVCEVGGQPVAIARDTARTRNLCGTLALMETAEVIARASLFIGIDSGPAHLAHAVGTPGVILLGRYHVFDRYTPYSGGYGDGSRAELVRSAGLARDISVAEVVAAVSRRLTLSAPPDASKTTEVA